MYYMTDLVVIGGGIAGLYTTYSLLKAHPGIKITLLECNDRLGGRIDTGEMGGVAIERGAGRFDRKKHFRLMALIKELDLIQNIYSISKSAIYIPVTRKNVPRKNVTRKKETVGGRSLAKLKSLCRNLTPEYLRKHTLLTIARKHLNKEECRYLVDSFGYYSELVIMNAYDALGLLKQLYGKQFCSLRGGLTQIIARLEMGIVKMGGNIRTSECVKSINVEKDLFIVKTKTEYFCKSVVCALPKEALERIPIFKQIQSILSTVVSSPLCRIYNQFETNWSDALPKTTTNNALRMVIPIKDGVLMTSYSDNIYANYWQNLWDKEGKEGTNSQLRRLIKQTFAIEMPNPIKTEICYWPHGVGYWSVNANSKEVAERMLQPFPKLRLYCCGENYSESFQQWIEGALETSDKVVFRVEWRS